MIPLEKPDLRRCAASFVTAAYREYALFLRICAPCIPVFLSGIRP